MLATGARELPPSPIGPAGRLFAKVAALASVAALVLSIGADTGRVGGVDAGAGSVLAEEVEVARQGSFSSFFLSPSPLLCIAGVAVLCVSFSVDFYQIWVILPREEAAAAVAGVADGETEDKSAGECPEGRSAVENNTAVAPPRSKMCEVAPPQGELDNCSSEQRSCVPERDDEYVLVPR